MSKKIFSGLIVFLLAGAMAGAQPPGKPGGSYTGILRANVGTDGLIDYDQVRINRGGDLYEFLSAQEIEDLSNMGENEKISFWINAYNANLIKVILAAQPPVEKLSAANPIYDEKFKAARWRVSLDLIRDRILRSDPAKGGPVAELSIPNYNPLILFALCDGTQGGPDLRRSAYTLTNINQELKDAASEFINDPRKIYVGPDGKLHLSSLFDWYSKDFETLGGVPAVIKVFLDPKIRADAPQILELLQNGFPGNAVYEYDWTLNSVKFKKT